MTNNIFWITKKVKTKQQQKQQQQQHNKRAT